MDPKTKARLFEEGGKLASDALKLFMSRPRKKEAEAIESTRTTATEVTELERIASDLGMLDKNEVTVFAKGGLIRTINGKPLPSVMSVSYGAGSSRYLDEHFEVVRTVEKEGGFETILKRKASLSKVPAISLPTSEETTIELKRRLARELYRAELDLAAGLKIAGKPCDCLSNKHTLMLEAAAEELISQEPDNPVYQEIIDWIGQNQSKVSIEAIHSGQYAADYPHMANEFKNLRKRVMGSTSTSEGAGTNLTLEEAKKMAAEEASKEVERAWKMEG